MTEQIPLTLIEAVHLIHIGEIIGILSEVIIGTSIVMLLDLTKWRSFYSSNSYDAYISLKDNGHNRLASFVRICHNLLEKIIFIYAPMVLMLLGLLCLNSLYFEELFGRDIHTWYYITLLIFAFLCLVVIIGYKLKKRAKKAENDKNQDIF
jgi:magnesium-transporting ATPase (P-type)